MLDSLATIVKKPTGKISIKVMGKATLSLDFEVDTLSLDIIDPTVLGIGEQENNEPGLFEKLKAAKKVGRILNNKGLSISILRKGKRGREATPIVSSLLTAGNDIQIDSISQVAKLDRDIKKSIENKD